MSVLDTLSVCSEVCGIDPGEHPGGRQITCQFVHATDMQHQFHSCSQSPSHSQFTAPLGHLIDI